LRKYQFQYEAKQQTNQYPFLFCCVNCSQYSVDSESFKKSLETVVKHLVIFLFQWHNCHSGFPSFLVVWVKTIIPEIQGFCCFFDFFLGLFLSFWCAKVETTIDRHSPVRILDDVKAVSTTDFFTMAIRNDYSLWMWGGYQLYPIKIMDDVSAVSASDTHFVIIKTDGTLWVAGDNSAA
jgi:hypothetical protein